MYRWSFLLSLSHLVFDIRQYTRKNAQHGYTGMNKVELDKHEQG